MEIEQKPEISHIRCCIACLKDENEVRVENCNDTNITEVYNVLVQIEVNQLGLPSLAICSICKDTLLLITEFRQQCLKSIDSLKSKLNFIPETVFIKEEKIDFDELLPETKVETSFLEDEKEEKFKASNTNLSSDESQATDDDDDDAESDEESETDESQSIKSESKETSTSRPRHNRDKIQRHYPCKQCECSYINRSSLERHVMKKHKGGSQCKYCSQVFLDIEEFNQHMQKEEATRSTVCCEQCGYTTKWKAGLRIHITKYHSPDQPRLICDICDKSYVLRAQFKQHFIMKHMEKHLQCSECGKKFSFNADLRKHIRDFHSPEGSVKGPNAVAECKYCNKTMKESSLKQHIQMVHLNFNKFSCKICSMEFTRVAILKRHMKTHDPEHIKRRKRIMPTKSGTGKKNEKTIPCDECDLSFKTKPDLAQHKISTHLDKETLETKYVSCKFCGELLRPHSLQVHVIRKHIDARKFKCDQCDKGYNSGRGLRLHKYSHTGEIPYKCNICASGFYQLDSLKKHFKNVHDIQYTTDDIKKNFGYTS